MRDAGHAYEAPLFHPSPTTIDNQTTLITKHDDRDDFEHHFDILFLHEELRGVEQPDDKSQMTDDEWRMTEKTESFRELKVYRAAFELQQEIFEVRGSLKGYLKMPHTPFIVIPAKAGIKSLGVFLDPRLRGGDGPGEF